jgi:orotidine-5'-phosphate decarboxylase
MCLKNADSRTVGLVVGATDTTALTRVRALAPHMWILCPGVGFQGGDLKVQTVAQIVICRERTDVCMCRCRLPARRVSDWMAAVF